MKGEKLKQREGTSKYEIKLNAISNAEKGFGEKTVKC